MKLSCWAKKQGISYRTAWRWFKAGTLPVPAVKTLTGTILVQEQDDFATCVTIYARVSSADQKQDLDRQVSRLVQYANSQNWVVAETITEIGSALNGHRSKLRKVLSNSAVKFILIEHSDRLTRFGVEYIEAVLAAQGRRLIIADSKELNDDLVQDMIDMLTSFCARLYGRRSAKHRAKKALESIQNEN